MDPTRRPSTPPQPLDPASASLPLPPWRTPLLIFTGLSLLAAGVALNAERLGLQTPQQDPSSSQPVVAAAPPIHRSAGVVEDGGSGVRHYGEEGKMGRPSAKTKLGLYAMKGPQSAVPQLARNFDPEMWAHEDGGFNGFVDAQADPKSTFSIDVDTAAYANARRHLHDAQLPPPDAVRTEELVNYFDYDYPEPAPDAPFSVTTEVGPAPWDATHRVVHVGIQGKTVRTEDIPPRNLVFLIDVSGSMSGPDQLGLVKKGLSALVEQMTARDRISLVVYAGAAGAVLPPTSGDDHRTITDALDRLEAGGSTNGGEGIHLAYALAQRSFIDGGINRVLIATDGDFNVGTTDDASLMKLIEAKRETGVFLSVLGVGSGNYDDSMMEQLADRGNGNYAYLDGEREARKVLVEESGGMLQTIAKDVKIQVEFDPAQVSAHRLIGYENRVLAHRDFDDDSKDAGEIGAGHTVTALYEVIPTEGADDAPLMTLNLRYKQPGGSRSEKLSVPVRDHGRALSETSPDYRFSAAVAMFGQKLRRSQAQADTTFAQIARMARDSVGADPYCYRHEFVALAVRAGTLVGESVDVAVPACEVKQPPRPRDLDASEPVEQPFEWSTFFIEVLRLLPPLLAMPVFAMASWRPRRRARLE